MLDLLQLPSTIIDTDSDTFDDVSGRLPSTIYGLRKRATSMLSSTIEERPLPLHQFEASYAKDVLGLDYGESEDALDEKLRTLAE